MNPRGCIIIKNGNATPRKVTRKDGTAMIFTEQKAAVDVGEDFPIPFTINLQDGQPPFPPGRYMLDPACLQVGDFDALKVGRRIELVPLPAAGK